MVNKYQAGGAAQGSILQEIAKLPQDKQKQIMTAFGKWAQAKGLNIQQLQGNEQALEQAMGQFLQEMQQAPKARLGAKLNYVRSLRGLAPEGMVVEYYKEGGQTKKRFVKPAGGEKVKDGKKEITDFKKACGGKTKKACGGRKFEDGGKSQKPKYTKDQIAGRTPVKVVNGIKYFLNGDGQIVKDPKGKNSGSWTQEDDNKMLKYRLKGTKNPSEKRDSIQNQMKWNNLPESEKRKHEVQEQKCGGKARKHQYGGSLNRIPFYQEGTPKGGITERSDNTRVASGRPQTVQNRIPWGAGKGPAGEGPMRLFNDPYIGMGMMAMAPMVRINPNSKILKEYSTRANNVEFKPKGLQITSSQIKPEYRTPETIKAISKIAGQPQGQYTTDGRPFLTWENIQQQSWDKLSKYLQNTKFTK